MHATISAIDIAVIIGKEHYKGDEEHSLTIGHVRQNRILTWVIFLSGMEFPACVCVFVRIPLWYN